MSGERQHIMPMLVMTWWRSADLNHPSQTSMHCSFYKGVSTAPKRPPHVPGGTWPTCAMVQARSGVGSYSRQALITEMLMTDTVSGPRALSSRRRLQGETWEARQAHHVSAQRKWALGHNKGRRALIATTVAPIKACTDVVPGCCGNSREHSW